MVEIRGILCPIDFSDFSRHALDHALAIAHHYQSTITLLHVCPVAASVVYAPEIAVAPSSFLSLEDRDAALAAMRRFAADEAGPGARISFEVAEGRAATEILDRARSRDSDLIVMGTHGRSGFERLLLGSVTEKVLRMATCPVLSVPRRVADAVPAPPVLFQRILCAVDFSDCATNALSYATSLASAAGARLTVVHVIEIPPEVSPTEHETLLSWPKSLNEYVAQAEEERRRMLTELVPDSGRSTCAVETVLAKGKADREILRVAAEQSSDLIVIGIHGRGAADLVFMGSTTQHVVRQAACPVLTLRQG
jgi:nucleotide-binding universal stress UspA family protein